MGVIIGFLVSGPLNHVLYDILNRVFAGKTGPKAKLLQLLASNLIISPIFNCGMYILEIVGTRDRAIVEQEVTKHGFDLSL